MKIEEHRKAIRLRADWKQDKTKTLTKEQVLEIIGSNEWEDPDIEGSSQDNGDMIVKSWRRNGLRAEQRRRLEELLI